MKQTHTAAEQRLILSISQLNAEVSQLLGQALPVLWVEGEISNLARPASGHLYFSLKDDKAQIRCALFRQKNLKLRFRPDNGMRVIARGRVGLYEPRGDYQFIIDHLEEAGEGELQRRFEALKQRLYEAGWFDETHKQALPAFPKRIGVITSPSGAAIRDIIQVLKRRSPHVPIFIYPTAVQGDTAAGQIVAALQQANREARCDVLILARGGGSLEDLWPFNEEAVAQAIYQHTVPIVSGVGHEIDVSIADFVADQRAPTPSAAAELVAPERLTLLRQIQGLQQQLQRQQQQQLHQQQRHLANLRQRLQLQHPANRLQQQNQRLDELQLRLQGAMQRYLQQKNTQLQQARQQWQHHSPLTAIQSYQQQVKRSEQALQQALQQQLAHKQEALNFQAARLQAYSPLATLKRGYTLTFDQQNQVIKQASQLKAQQSIRLRFQDGEALCTVDSLQPIAKP